MKQDLFRGPGPRWGLGHEDPFLETWARGRRDRDGLSHQQLHGFLSPALPSVDYTTPGQELPGQEGPNGDGLLSVKPVVGTALGAQGMLNK